MGTTPLNKNFIKVTQSNGTAIFLAIDDISYLEETGTNTVNFLYLKSKPEPIKTKLDFEGFSALLY
jgi:hypothetical protein